MQGPGLILFALRRASNLVSQDFQSALGQAGVRPTAFAVMRLIRDRPGMRQGQLSPAVGIRRTNLVPLLADLERRGLSERRPVPGDRRAAALHLTPQGLAMIEACEQSCAHHEARLAARLGPEGRATLLGLLHRLTDESPDQPE